MNNFQQATDMQIESVEIDREETRAVTLEEIATRELQECSCICYYPAK